MSAEDAIRDWLAEPRRIVSRGGESVDTTARTILLDFWDAHPDHRPALGAEREAVAQLEAIAHVAGFEDAVKLCTSAVVEGDGCATLTLAAQP